MTVALLFPILKRAYFRLQRVHAPAPRWLYWLLYWLVVLGRQAWYALWRIFWAEPAFKAICRRYGKNLRTGPRLHWVQGEGDLILGDHVSIDGQCNFFFSSRYGERPSFWVGDHSGIGHHCSFVVGKSIRIGSHCRLGAEIVMFDSPGHPLDPLRRKVGEPAGEEEVRPIEVGDNVWIGTRAVIFPGVKIGDNSVVAMGSVVMSEVPANTVVMGNPARQVKTLSSPAQQISVNNAS